MNRRYEKECEWGKRKIPNLGNERVRMEEMGESVNGRYERGRIDKNERVRVVEEMRECEWRK